LYGNNGRSHLLSQEIGDSHTLFDNSVGTGLIIYRNAYAGGNISSPKSKSAFIRRFHRILRRMKLPTGKIPWKYKEYYFLICEHRNELR
jgi:hypothetical protein